MALLEEYPAVRHHQLVPMEEHKAFFLEQSLDSHILPSVAQGCRLALEERLVEFLED